MLEFLLIISIVSQIIFKNKNYLLYYKFEPSNVDFLITEKGDIKYWWADKGCSSFVYVRNGGNQPPQVEGCLTVKELVGHLMEHLGRNEPNYFMYDSWGLCPSLPLTHQVQAAPASQSSLCTAPHH